MALIDVPLFREKDLNLQVRLDTCADGEAIDFTGKKSYTFGLMRDGVGFGITSVNIVINASLQPIIEITFKDIYGNTLFGTQRYGGSLMNDKEAFNRSTEIDYSVLFNWPPPKFFFTFKGYLGQPVTWILNLKKTSTNFNTNDGSFETKVTFVPNQWGFFADMPFLFLLAVKSLKTKYTQNPLTPNELKELTTIFDLIKIGKKIDVKKQQASKEFDVLINQISTYQSNLAGAITISKSIKLDTMIKGEVNGKKIKGFKDFVVVTPDFELESSLNDNTEFNKLNHFLISTATIFDGDPSSRKEEAQKFNQNSFKNYDITSKTTDFERAMNLMSQNRQRVEDAKSLYVIEQVESKIGTLTISNVFSKLAGDSAYILGRIIEAGYGVFSPKGISGNIPIGLRYSKSDFAKFREGNPEIIGKYFPMVINDKSEELPAIKQNMQGKQFEDVGADYFEMEFVKQFISAIAEGIASNKLQDTDNSFDGINTLVKRVSNAEMIQGNPYASNYESIASNILERSGIISYITRSDDPNRPGNYGNTTYFDNDSVGEIAALANADMENVTDKIISELFEEDILKLKRFCLFFKNLFDEKGEVFQSSTTIPKTPAKIPYQQKQGDVFNTEFFKGLSVLTTDNEVTNVTDFFENEVFWLFNTTQTSKTLNEINNDFKKSYQLRRFVNNDIPYIGISNDNAEKDNNYYGHNKDLIYMIKFEGDESSKALSSQSSPSDSERKESEHDDPNGVMDAEEPIGIVSVTTTRDEKGSLLGRVKYYNEDYVQNSKVVDYNKLKQIVRNIDDYGRVDFLEPKDKTITQNEQLPNGGIAFTVFSVAGRTKDDEDIIWGPFMNSKESKNQRVALYSMCNSLYEKLKKEEQKRRELVGTILGNSKDYENIIYKQFHLIFNQWNLLAFDDKEDFDFYGPAPNLCNPYYVEGNLARDLELKYGAKEKHTRVKGATDSELEKTVTFRYDYPMNIVGNSDVNVEDSLINIEPLYDAKSNTTVLNIIQQVCDRNHFIFIPIPGNADYRNISDIYRPDVRVSKINIRNYFHVLFAPTPERRAYGNGGFTRPNNSGSDDDAKKIKAEAIVFTYGGIDNKVVRSISVGTEDNKMTAESIINLQRLVDNDNRNKKVTTDCSLLPVLEGRSYKASLDVIGNSQIYPMQYFYIPRMPMFGGLYQIMSVSHNITPNDMTTSIEGIKLLLAGDYGGQKPITLSGLKSELKAKIDAPNEIN